MIATSTMRMKVLAYVSGRRAGGFALSIDEQQLLRFARFVDQSGYRGPLTVQLASRWRWHRRASTFDGSSTDRSPSRLCPLLPDLRPCHGDSAAQPVRPRVTDD